MDQAGQIQQLKDRSLKELDHLYDYYADTRHAWSLVRVMISTGHRFTDLNKVTGTITTQNDLLQKSQGYLENQLTEATFQQFLAIFENFYFDLVRLWLTAYPESLGKKTIDFRSVLQMPDKEAIVDLVVSRELNEVAYQRPTDWFAYLDDRAKLGCPSPAEIERIAEAKASRDLLAHNRGMANKAYEFKAGRLARFRDGERIEVNDPYHREVWLLLKKVVADLSEASAAKVATGY